MKTLKIAALLSLLMLVLLAGCEGVPDQEPFDISGRITYPDGQGIENVKINIGQGEKTVETDEEGNWEATVSGGNVLVVPICEEYSFYPAYRKVQEDSTDLTFSGAEMLVDFWQHITFNAKKVEAFQDLRVRKALFKAIDREAIVMEISNHFDFEFEIAHAPYSPRMDLLRVKDAVDIGGYDYDPERAKALLEEAGYGEEGDQLTVPFYTTKGDMAREMIQESVSEMWEEIGVEVVISNKTAQEIFDPGFLYGLEWEGVMMFAWGSRPEGTPIALWHSERIPQEGDDYWEDGYNKQNVAGWENPEADALMDKMTDEDSYSLEERQEFMAEFIEIWVEEIPAIPLYFTIEFEGY